MKRTLIVGTLAGPRSLGPLRQRPGGPAGVVARPEGSLREPLCDRYRRGKQFPSKYYTGEPRANDMTPARLRQIDEPKLFVAGTKDVQLPGTAQLRPGVTSVRFAADARRMFAAAGEPKELVLLDSSFHSSELVTTAWPADIVGQTRRAVFGFLSANSRM